MGGRTRGGQTQKSPRKERGRTESDGAHVVLAHAQGQEHGQ